MEEANSMWFKKKKKPADTSTIITPRDYAFALKNFVNREFGGNKYSPYDTFSVKDAEDLARLYPEIYNEYLERWLDVKLRDYEEMI
jgi:hypothetical protein